MKEETRTKKTEYKVYVADDGKEFNSFNRCYDYEKRKYKEMYQNLPCVTFCLNDIYEDKELKDVYEDGGNYTYFKIFPIRNKEDMEIINGYLIKKSEFDDLLTEEYIGKSAFICESEFNVWLADGYTIETMKNEIVSNLDRLIDKVKVMENEYLN